MWIEEYAFHIWNYKSKTLLDMELNALNRIITDNPKYSKEIDEKIKIIQNRINEIIKKD